MYFYYFYRFIEKIPIVFTRRPNVKCFVLLSTFGINALTFLRKLFRNRVFPCSFAVWEEICLWRCTTHNSVGQSFINDKITRIWFQSIDAAKDCVKCFWILHCISVSEWNRTRSCGTNRFLSILFFVEIKMKIFWNKWFGSTL